MDGQLNTFDKRQDETIEQSPTATGLYLEVGFSGWVGSRMQLSLKVALSQFEEAREFARHPICHVLDKQYDRWRRRLRAGSGQVRGQVREGHGRVREGHGRVRAGQVRSGRVREGHGRVRAGQVSAGQGRSWQG